MAALATRLGSIFLTTIMVLGVMAPSASAGSHENEALALLNAERTAAGLAPVSMHSDLTDDALAWSQHLFSQGSLSHNPNLSSVTSNWDRLGENVGVGTSIDALHAAFMNSSGHRGNILGDYDHVGIAVVAETSSKLWITVVFMKSLDGTSAAETGEEPEPYSEVQPTVDNDQPAANLPTARVASTSPATPPAPRKLIVFVRVGPGPIAD
jgi:hypothetical protein